MNKQELIAKCKKDIAEMRSWHDSDDYLKDIEIYEIALASLTAEPAAMFFKSEYGDVFNTESGWRPVGGVNLLYTAPPAPVDLAALVPDGWKLVPIEPTDKMLVAGDTFMDGLSELGNAYSAMLAAAPKLEGVI